MREVIFEQNIYNGIKGRLKALFCYHVDDKIIDINIPNIPNINLFIIIWECVNCKRKQLWILKEEY